MFYSRGAQVLVNIMVVYCYYFFFSPGGAVVLGNASSLVLQLIVWIFTQGT